VAHTPHGVTLRYYGAHVLMIVKLFEEFTEAWGF
jgi:hypothetical protein